MAQKGQKTSEETKIKQSLAAQGRVFSPVFFEKGKATRYKKGQVSPNKGKKMSDEARQKMSIAKTGKKLHFSVEHCRKLKEAHYKRIWSGKNKDTKPELKVETELIRLNINYEKQVPLCKIAIVDFYLPEYRIVIQVDGCFWHCCPIHKPNSIEGRVERDLKQNSVLSFNGFNVYRIWEHDIMDKDFNLNNFIKLYE